MLLWLNVHEVPMPPAAPVMNTCSPSRPKNDILLTNIVYETFKYSLYTVVALQCMCFIGSTPNNLRIVHG